MPSPLENSLFGELLYTMPQEATEPNAILGGISGSSFQLTEQLEDLPIVILDFETTDVNPAHARIIEIGAIKYVKRKEIGRFSTLVHPGQALSSEITKITGITPEMLEGQPTLEQVIHDFHDFLRGCVCVAHNAEFDMSVLAYESYRFGITFDYYTICTLKMARALVKIERRRLDDLAQHYNLSFEARHRSIGDIQVTAQVLWHMLDEHPELKTLQDFEPYRQPMLKL